MKIKAGLVGSAGLSAEVLIKLLRKHKNVDLNLLVSGSHPGTRISDIHRSLKGFNKKTAAYDPEEIINRCDVVFISRPHIVSMGETVELVRTAARLKKKTRFIDLSGDFRLKDSGVFEEWYVNKASTAAKKIWKKQKPDAIYKKVLKNSVYGLPELFRDRIKKASFIANPGCYPTGALLGLVPVLKAGLVSKDIVINAYSGISGAGRTGKSGNIIAPDNDVMPYKIAEHQHIPEIEQGLADYKRLKVSFAPHVMSFDYGIMTTINVKSAGTVDREKLYKIYKNFYKSHFVRILKADCPRLNDVVGTNYCDIGFAVDSRNGRVVVVTAIDNLYKGASGQAVQNMNIMFGLKETEGLIAGK